MTDQPVNPPQFFLTSPAPCPYLSDRQERKVFTHLVGDRASELNDILTQGGFRRSQNIAYRPACDRCSACTSVRVRASEFKPTRSMKRVWKANQDLIGHEYAAEPTSEQYSLFRSYIDARHQSGGMSDMSVLDYTMMVEDSHVDSRIIEYRRRGIDTALTKKGEGGLIAVALMDVMADGLSMVYSFFDPASRGRSLGTFMILDHIERARKRGLPHVYLGYWVNGSQKMAYKIRFQPQDHLLSQGWTLYEHPNEGTDLVADTTPNKKS